MAETISFGVRQGILECLSDGKTYKIKEIKEWLEKEKGLKFGDDYLVSHLSGALGYLVRNEQIENTDRGTYVVRSKVAESEPVISSKEESEEKTESEQKLVKTEDQKPVTQEEQKPAAKDEKKMVAKSEQFEQVKKEILDSIQAEYAILSQKAKEIPIFDVAIMDDVEVENARRIFRLLEYLKKFRYVNGGGIRMDSGREELK